MASHCTPRDDLLLLPWTCLPTASPEVTSHCTPRDGFPLILLSPKTASDEVILRGLSQASLQSEMSSQPREACRALGSRGRQTGHLHTRVHTDTRTASSSPGNPCVRKHGCPRPVLVLRNLFTPHRALSSLSPGTAYRSWMLTAKEKSGCEELCLRLNGGRQARGMCVE